MVNEDAVQTYGYGYYFYYDYYTYTENQNRLYDEYAYSEQEQTLCYSYYRQRPGQSSQSNYKCTRLGEEYTVTERQFNKMVWGLTIACVALGVLVFGLTEIAFLCRRNSQAQKRIDEIRQRALQRV